MKKLLALIPFLLCAALPAQTVNVTATAAGVLKSPGTFWTANAADIAVAAAGSFTDDAIPVEKIDGAVPSTRTFTTTAPLTIDGGSSADFSANRTLAVSTATTSAAGVVQLATPADATAGTSDTKAVTPLSLPPAITAGGFDPAQRADLYRALYAAAASGHRPSVLHFGDSLVMGASGGTYTQSFAFAWEQAFGFAGLGYFGFGGGGGGNNLAGGELLFSNSDTNPTYPWNPYTNGWSEWSAPQTTGDGSYSPNGCGIYVTSASGKTLYIRASRGGFTRATLFFLRKSGGGSFVFGNPLTSTTTSVDCSGDSTELATVSFVAWDGTPTDNHIALTSVTGDVALFGILLDTPSNGGLSFSAGKGGTPAQTFAALNGDAFTSFVSTLHPAIVTINLGTNDYSTRTAAQFEADLGTIVARIRAYSATVPIILQIATVHGNQSNYQAAYAAVASTYGCSLVWWKNILGDYPAFIAGDNTHPTAQGVTLLGRSLAQLFGADMGLSGKHLWPYVSLDYAPNLIADPGDTDLVHAASTHWGVASGTGLGSATVALDGSNGLSILNGASNFGGASLAADYFGGALTEGGTYAIQYDVVAGTGYGWPYTYVDSTGTRQNWRWLGGNSAASGTYMAIFGAAAGTNKITYIMEGVSTTQHLTGVRLYRIDQ